MAKMDNITTSSKTNSSTAAATAPAGAFPNTSATIRVVNESHKTTAATLAKVAAAREELRIQTPILNSNTPSIPPKDSLPLHDSPLSPGMSTFNQATAVIQRIAESGAPPNSRKTPKSSSKATSLRTPSKSPTAIKTPTFLQVRTSGPPSSPLPDESSTGLSRLGHHRPSRSSSQDKNFLKKIKKGREQIQADGLKAANFLNKVSHQTWDKLKNQRLTPGKSGNHGRSASPSQHGYAQSPTRDTTSDIDVFGMPLKETVVRTRIVRSRKMSGDATYWMPAIAYRCLQYLNVYGPHELGIYRISGSTSVVDDLRAEFKMHHDVDLFESPPDDLHTVSSLLKGWFRSLPDAILPQDVQKRIYDKCKDETESPRPPKAFVDELSRLPPYNYYLLHHLFSHLSTICMASEVNKMGLANLGMIFCSTLRIDRFCFNWLVNSWGDCWAGCLTEEDEYERTLRRDSTPTSISASTHTSADMQRWPSSSSIARPASRARSDRYPEHERECDLETQSLRDSDRKEHLETRTDNNSSPSVYSLDDDRHLSMVVEANGTPRGSVSSASGRGGEGMPPKPPAKIPLSP